MPRGRRKLTRYLGPDVETWDDPDEKGTVWLRIRPDSLVAKDLSYAVAGRGHLVGS